LATDKLEGGLLVYFSVLVFPLPLRGNFSADALGRLAEETWRIINVQTATTTANGTMLLSLGRNRKNTHTHRSGAAPRGDWGKSPPTPQKGHFYKSSKTDEKILGIWGGGGDVTNHT